MTDWENLRHRANQQASFGNYWAGKCVSLFTEIDRLSEEVESWRNACHMSAEEAAGVTAELRAEVASLKRQLADVLNPTPF